MNNYRLNRKAPNISRLLITFNEGFLERGGNPSLILMISYFRNKILVQEVLLH